MSTGIWSDWYDYVLPEVPGCPQALATQRIRQVAIDFFTRTTVWRVAHAPVNLVAGQGVYPFVPLANTLVIDVTYASYTDSYGNVTELYPRSISDLDNIMPATWRTDVGTPQYYTSPAEGISIQLVDAPDTTATAALNMTVALKPTQDSTGVTSALFEQYVNEITHGALARLFAMSKKKWSDPGLATYYASMYEGDVGINNLRASRGFTRAPHRTTVLVGLG